MYQDEGPQGGVVGVWEVVHQRVDGVATLGVIVKA